MKFVTMLPSCIKDGSQNPRSVAEEAERDGGHGTPSVLAIRADGKGMKTPP